MFNLVRNELTKIFHKKTLYIVLAIFLILSIIGVFLNNAINNLSFVEVFEDGMLKEMEEYLKTIDKSTEEGKYEYSSVEAEIEYLRLLKRYGQDSWQATIIEEQLYDKIMELSYYRNGVYGNKEGNNQEQEDLKKEYDKIIERLESGNWKAFAQEDLDKINNQIKLNKSELKNSADRNMAQNLQQEIELLETQKQVKEWRIEKDISYGFDEKNMLLEEYEFNKTNVIYSNYNYEINENNYKDKNNDTDYTYAVKKEYQNNLSQYNIAQYKIKNSIAEEETVTYYLQHLFESNGLMFTIIISAIFAGTIVNEEFNKGTIKLLLVRPYSRRKILFSKLIACFIIVAISIVSIISIQLVILGVAYGFDTIKIPVVLFDYNTNSVITMNVLKYLAINILNILPMIMIYILLSFFIGSALKNSSLAIAVSLLLYMSTSVVESIAQGVQLTWLKYIPIFNWDLTQYLYGKLPLLEGTNIGWSIAMCIDMVLVLLIITFYNFERRDVKNI